MIEVPSHDVLAKDRDPMRCCGICEYFTSPDRCGYQYIIDKFGSKVDFYWCCDFFERNKSIGSTSSLLKRAMKKADG